MNINKLQDIARRRIALTMLFLPVIALAKGNKEHIDFIYNLNWNEKGYIEVSLSYTPQKQDTDTLYYGDIEFGGQKDIFVCVKNLNAKGALVEPDSANLRIILHQIKPGKAIKIQYNIMSRLPNSHLDCPMEMFRPNITEKFIFCHGVNLFLRHNNIENEQQSVTWGKKPDFPVFCLYNPGKGLSPYKSSVTEFQNSLIVGDTELHTDSILIDKTMNYVVTAIRKNKIYNEQLIKSYFEKYYKGMCRFWQEKEMPSYSLILYPFEKIPFNASGIGLNHGFCARYDAKADTVLTSSRIDLVSHEIGHNWISSDFQNQWFGEGFNEMQTMYSIVATDVKPAGSFINYINGALYNLHKSEIKNLPNDSISINFWKLGDYSWIPYWRGAVYAFRLLGQIEHSNGDIHAYKHLMMALKGETTNMNKDKFLRIASNFIDEKILNDEFERFIIKGETITLNENMMPSGVKLSYRQDGTPFIEIIDKEKFKLHFILD